MKDQNLRKKLNPVDSSIGYLGGILALTVATYIITIIILLVYLDAALTDSGAVDKLMEDPVSFAIITLVSQLALFGFVLIFTKLRKIDFFEAYQIKKAPKISVIAIIPFLALFLILSDLPMLSALDDIFRRINYRPSEANIAAFLNNPWGFLLIAILVCALPALFEELIFRGIVLQGLASRYRPTVAILLSALAFSLTHMSPAQTAHQFVIGVALGYIVLATKSIWSGVLLHFCNNLWALLMEIIPAKYLTFPWLDNMAFIYIGGIFFAILGLIAFCLAVDFANKNVSEGILAQSIKRFVKREKYTGYSINYDVVLPPPPTFAALMPMTEEDYNNYLIAKQKRGKRLFIGLFVTAVAICLASWFLSLFSVIVESWMM